MSADIVKLENVTKLYYTNSHSVRGVKGIELSAAKGELLLILGPSGSGKTTIITLAAGLLEPTEGRVHLFGKDIRKYSRSELQEARADRIGFVFQTFLLIDSLTISENIKLVQGFSKKDGKAPPEELLRKFSIGHLKDNLPYKLSQGEKQRAAIARAVANNAELILADEPTANLDSEQGYEIIRLLGHYAKEGKCVIAVSHDQRIAGYADRIVKIEDGKIA